MGSITSLSISQRVKLILDQFTLKVIGGPPRIEGPAMKFFDFGDESDNYAWRTSSQTMKGSHEIPDASNLTNSPYLSRVEKEYILLILHQE